MFVRQDFRGRDSGTVQKLLNTLLAVTKYMGGHFFGPGGACNEIIVSYDGPLVLILPLPFFSWRVSSKFFVFLGSSQTHHEFVSLFFHQKNLYGFGIGAVDFFASKGVGGFVNAAALNRIGSRDIVQTAVAHVGASVMQGFILTGIVENNEHSFGQVLSFKPDGTGLCQFRCLGKIYGQGAGVILPAFPRFGFVCGWDTENTLPYASFQKFYGHGVLLLNLG